MWFDRQKFFTQFDNSGLLKLNLHIFETISSTNVEVWQRIDSQETLPLVAIAKQQTAGKGQWGRIWQSPIGGLYLSIGMAIDLSVKDLHHVTLFTAWGIVARLRQFNIPVLLKWPNDLVIEGKKLGGIKTETRISEQKCARIVIGIGINWLNTPPTMGINLKSLNSEIETLEQLSAIVLEGIFCGYERYLSIGIKGILSHYLKLLDSLGKEVQVAGATGKIIGVNERGELQVSLFSPGASVQINIPPGQISLGYIQ
jgi:BirA family biotin operon repressor/biotin-[acetyl-CoA-carboxylase] ligase